MRIAITGIIGSGKSTVINLLREVGEICVSADEINARLLTDSTYIQSLAKIFPSVVIDGIVDKSKLSEIVFNDSYSLEKLENLAQPLIIDEIIKKTSGKGIYFCEIPTLKEQFVEVFDEIWYIDSDETLLTDRIRQRGDTSDVAKRIRAHDKYRSIKLISTLIIHNNGDISYLRDQVYGELQSLKSRTKLV